jgi:transcriptional regulator with XRE-family HTH domain
MRQSRAIWAKRVERWKRSGLTGAEFAAQLGVKEATLRHWKWQLERRGKSPSAEFIEVVAAPDALTVEPRALEVVVGALRVVVPVDFDEDTLRRLLRVVESR